MRRSSLVSITINWEVLNALWSQAWKPQKYINTRSHAFGLKGSLWCINQPVLCCACQHIGMQQLVKATCLWAFTIWSLAMEIAPNNHHWSTNYENICESIGLFLRVLTTKVLVVSYECKGHEWFFLFFSFMAIFFQFWNNELRQTSKNMFCIVIWSFLRKKNSPLEWNQEFWKQNLLVTSDHKIQMWWVIN